MHVYVHLVSLTLMIEIKQKVIVIKLLKYIGFCIKFAHTTYHEKFSNTDWFYPNIIKIETKNIYSKTIYIIIIFKAIDIVV